MSTTKRCLARQRAVAYSFSMTMAQKIKKRREELGISQADLGRSLGITAQAVQKWEYGKSWPTGKRLQQVAKLLGVTVDYLTETEESAERHIPDELLPYQERIAHTDQFSVDRCKLIWQIAGEQLNYDVISWVTERAIKGETIPFAEEYLKHDIDDLNLFHSAKDIIETILKKYKKRKKKDRDRKDNEKRPMAS